MAQLIMYWKNDGKAPAELQLPSDVTVATFPTRSTAMEDWLDIIQYGLSEKREDESYYYKAMSMPEYFAAIIPICGGGMCWNCIRLKDVPIWAFHGALDDTVLPEESMHMVAAVNRNGGNAKITVYNSFIKHHLVSP